jgi:uncharacterized protein YjbJ (UPF0337 family)
MSSDTKDYFSQKWHELKGTIKENWGKLTDDDMQKIEGKKERLISTLQAKYQYSKEQAEQEVEKMIK